MTSKSLSEIPKAPPSEELDQLIAWRREFHSYPEIRWTEFWTSAQIIEILQEMGFNVLYGEELYDVLGYREYEDKLDDLFAESGLTEKPDE